MDLPSAAVAPTPGIGTLNHAETLRSSGGTALRCRLRPRSKRALSMSVNAFFFNDRDPFPEPADTEAQLQENKVRRKAL